ncbi:putative Mg2+ transporter-C (MgtC) family protein [Pseudobutyrivibrio sp. YE44]|uniref:MgtC/SapB family protein n=1 Tax=Pseudobutyrivibrio sp. YE44 TaxID=1520802 RepID=UPI00087FA46D|nr:MgtC/SapB family protein [Pseudobutyrivibrio sp. YE44]SDB05452.1 putative Mg2+ transporter-C (MgtC) family protein [Pseudobutyrivibrio sp. YE44]
MVNVLFKNSFELEVIVRLAFALISGFLLGIERSYHGKAAGIRTYMLVGIGACMFAAASKYGFVDMLTLGERADVSRVASNIVTGVSFLAAGAIYFKREKVTGLTTAAGIWVMAAIGTAYGCGMYIVATVATLYLFGIQTLLKDKMTKRLHVKVPNKVDILMDSTEKCLNRVLSVFEEYNIDVENTGIKRQKGDLFFYSFEISIPETTTTLDVVNALASLKNVQSVDMGLT